MNQQQKTQMALTCMKHVQGGFLRRVRRAARRVGRGISRANRAVRNVNPLTRRTRVGSAVGNAIGRIPGARGR